MAGPLAIRSQRRTPRVDRPSGPETRAGPNTASRAGSSSSGSAAPP